MNHDRRESVAGQFHRIEPARRRRRRNQRQRLQRLWTMAIWNIRLRGEEFVVDLDGSIVRKGVGLNSGQTDPIDPLFFSLYFISASFIPLTSEMDPKTNPLCPPSFCCVICLGL